MGNTAIDRLKAAIFSEIQKAGKAGYRVKAILCAPGCHRVIGNMVMGTPVHVQDEWAWGWRLRIEGIDQTSPLEEQAKDS